MHGYDPGMSATTRIFACFLLLVSGCVAEAPPPAQTVQPTVLLVSVDGLRADVIGSGAMPTLDRLAASGVHARWMTPSYPSLTFPNHYTLVTGLRPDHHGIVNNTMHDPALGWFSIHAHAAVEDPLWWGGEPVWVTLQKRGGRAATMYWPGSEAPISGQYPTDWFPFDAAMPAAARVARVLSWLDRPAATRPGFITLYFDEVDHAEHGVGPDGAEVRAAQREVDTALARLWAGLGARHLRDAVDLVVVSDHGMAAVPPGQVEYLDDFLASQHLPISALDITSRGTAVGVAPASREVAAAVEAALVGRHPHSQCWDKADVPARWHYGTHPRIPAIVCQADVGWELGTRDGKRPHDTVTGAHGYDPQSPEMRAVFVATGPDFRKRQVMAPFDNVDVYPLLMRLLRVPAQPNDGDPHTFDKVLK
jgi:predicted AlkP superfamily pyrophosphatase or phosphodiesterase